MKATVYYFSGTGNSLRVAKDIAGALGAEAVAMARLMQQPTISNEATVIGLVFPVYMWGVPLIVRRFIAKLGNLSGKYLFAIATCAGSAGGTISMVGNMVKKQQGTLAGGFTVGMPNNYIPMGGADAPEKQQNAFDRWQQKMLTILTYVQEQRQGHFENSNPVSSWLFSSMLNTVASPQIPVLDKSFMADANCNGCGICQKVCPVGNVVIKDGKPLWNRKCEQCFACLQWCPQAAVQFGKGTTGRKRYTHPAVKLSDMLQ